ncbi:Abi family protein [Arthrobacter rhombi]|uniref:Abi family protein n=1 Tax=Arthrobacter rhombi TaxID=71253 RepID=UPI003FD05087
MAEYTKQWLCLEDQISKLTARGVEVPDLDRGKQLLRAVGYYRLTGYLYPFRKSETDLDADGRQRQRVLNHYREDTTIDDAAAVIAFDRKLRMLILEGIEQIEVSLRMQVGYVLGRRSAFAHLDPATFVGAFIDAGTDPTTGESTLSKHERWILKAAERQNASDEAFVAHFREKYEDRMPIWALTEILEMGQLSRLYGGLTRSLAGQIASAYAVPSKKVMYSWISSLNYVRNVAAHHARIFNRKLVVAPGRPAVGQVPLLDHLKDEESSKRVFGLYNALAVMAYLLRSIDPDSDWQQRMVDLIESFPETEALTKYSLGLPRQWPEFELWRL